jgi:hypothetical protein
MIVNDCMLILGDCNITSIPIQPPQHGLFQIWFTQTSGIPIQPP